MSYFETNLGPANSYYRVTQSFTLFERVGVRGSNCYFGSSQILEPVYQELQTRPGAVILHLHGGIFYADRQGLECRPVVLLPNPKSPFEKRYLPDRHDWPLDKLERIDSAPYVAPARSYR